MKYTVLPAVLSGLLLVNAAAFADTPATTAPATSAPAANTAKISSVDVSFKQKEKRLYAYIHITQSENVPGTITVKWTPPAHTGCTVSQYDLTYKNLSYNTNAYRTVKYEFANGKTMVCLGTWNLEVVDANGNSLAKASTAVASVPDDAAPAPVAPQAAASSAVPAASAG